jgi:hypothetical protein
VLERNVSVEVATAYKRASLADVSRLGRLIRRHLGELGDQDAERLAAGAVLVAGALWAHAQPSPAVLAAYEADPALAVMRTDFTATTREVLEVLIAGLLARSAR